MKTNTVRCLAALVVAGAGLSACQTIPSNYSTSFNEGASAAPDLLTVAPSMSALSSTDSEPLAAEVPEPRAKPSGEERLANVQPRIVAGDLQCVPFARDASGIDIRGNASRWWTLAAGKYHRSRHPQDGSVFVMRGYKTALRGHVAVVRDVLDDRTIVVDHANWGNDGRIYLSSPIRDESPKNDWSRVRVWNTAANQWGSRVYRAKGFIYPMTSIASGGALSRSN